MHAAVRSNREEGRSRAAYTYVYTRAIRATAIAGRHEAGKTRKDQRHLRVGQEASADTTTSKNQRAKEREKEKDDNPGLHFAFHERNGFYVGAPSLLQFGGHTDRASGNPKFSLVCRKKYFLCVVLLILLYFDRSSLLRT